MTDIAWLNKAKIIKKLTYRIDFELFNDKNLSIK